MDPRRRAAVAFSTFRGLFFRSLLPKIAKRKPQHAIFPSVRHGWRISEVRCQKFQMEWGDLKPFFFQKKKSENEVLEVKSCHLC